MHRAALIGLAFGVFACGPSKPAKTAPDESLLEGEGEILDPDAFDARSNETSTMEDEAEVELDESERETHGEEDDARATGVGLDAINHSNKPSPPDDD